MHKLAYLLRKTVFQMAIQESLEPGKENSDCSRARTGVGLTEYARFLMIESQSLVAGRSSLPSDGCERASAGSVRRHD